MSSNMGNFLEKHKPMPKLCVIYGDGIGKEVVPAAITVLQALLPDLELEYAQAGWECFLEHGTSVPQETIRAIRQCGAALFGAVSSPAKKVEGYRSAVITMRQALDLYANLRPIKSLPQVSPRSDVDLLIVRENTEGLYSGRERREGDTAIAERIITKGASQRIAEKAVILASKRRRKRLTIVHKANILPISDGLFRDTVRETAAACQNDLGTDIEINELLVDVAALKMIASPQEYDVIVTTNLFGDILSDEAAYWCGGLGYAPSINWGDDAAVAEPVHGSAPDIAGQGIANPIATILSAALLARMVWRREDQADRLEKAVERTLSKGIGVRIGEHTTQQITSAVLDHLC